MHEALMLAINAFPITHLTNGGDGAHLELWQAVNLVGCPILALMLLPAVIDDIQRWMRWRREQSG